MCFALLLLFLIYIYIFVVACVPLYIFVVYDIYVCLLNKTIYFFVKLIFECIFLAWNFNYLSAVLFMLKGEENINYTILVLKQPLQNYDN